LSGGQQQRVALARSLAKQPQLLLLDEPLGALDKKLREETQIELVNIIEQVGVTCVMVTHDQEEAMTMASRIAVMSEGRFLQVGAPGDIYETPATRFVADFIGHGVFAPARIVATADGPHVQTPLGALSDATECPLPSAYPGGECDVLLRADDIVHDDAAAVKARIERKAFRGSEFLYTLRLATGERVLAHVPSHHNHQVGEWIGIRAVVDHVVTFERAPVAAPTAATLDSGGIPLGGG
jgi:iron(III) transport system ATP-binding protein